jgi:uncharacterized protein
MQSIFPVQIRPFNIFIWKISSRCNLNCDYCYVYNSEDSSWRKQPKLMSELIAKQAAIRIREHAQTHNLLDVDINFHGGEPLMGGKKHLKQLIDIIEDIFKNTEINVNVGMQSNGLLFTQEIGDFLVEKDISIGISLDGPPAINDLHRVDLQGKATTSRLVEKINLLSAPPYVDIFGGFLAVINAKVDPSQVFDYLISFDIEHIDLLLPLNNHDRLPIGKEIDNRLTPYGDWLIEIFDRWFYHQKSHIRIRLFDSIIRLLWNKSSLVEAIGLDPVALLVIETDGSIEAVDTLKTTFDGAAALDRTVFDYDFDTIAQDSAIQSRQQGIDGLCRECQDCPIVDVCGGGYLPHRYSEKNGFNNPSVYCTDLQKLIWHIQAAIINELDPELLESVVL